MMQFIEVIYAILATYSNKISQRKQDLFVDGINNLGRTIFALSTIQKSWPDDQIHKIELTSWPSPNNEVH